MITHASVLAAAIMSVTFGYEPSQDADRGYDYIVQVEPELLDDMKKGLAEDIEVNIPQEVSPVRRIRIVVGSDELPRKLRPPQTRSTMRPDIEAGAGGALLAQTGPGFGRGAAGFNPGPSGGDSTTARPTTTPATVPSLDTRYQVTPTNQFQPNQQPTPYTAGTSPTLQARQPEPPLGAVGESANRLRETVRDTVNTLGQGGQQVLDQGRTTLGNLVSPPDNRNYNPQASPLVNLAESARSELRHTGEAVRDTWARSTTTDQNSASFATTMQTPQYQPPSTTGQYDNWGAPTGLSNGATTQQPTTNQAQPTQYPQDPQQQYRYAQEQSVLNQHNPAQNPSASAAAPILSPPLVDQWGNPQAPSGTPSSVATGLDQGFDQYNRATSTNTRPTVPVYDSNTALPSGSSWRDTSTVQPSSSQQPGSNVATWDLDNNSSRPASRESDFPQPTTQPTTPVLSSNPPANSGVNTTPSNTFENFGSLGGNTQQASISAPPTQSSSASSSNTGLNALAWAIAIGSFGANLFQWVNIVDLRNKYRVALRRTSPSFGRNAAA